MNKKLSLAVTIALSITSVNAMQFQTLGYNAIGMGGAGVANSSGSVATYNNPALLAKKKYDVEISLGGGASTYDHGAGASIQALDNSGFLDTIDKASENVASLTASDKQNLINGKNIVLGMNGNAVEIAPHAHLAAQIDGFGIGVFGFSDVVATAVVDQAHNQLIVSDGTNYVQIADDGTETSSTQGTYDVSSMQYAIDNGLTYLDARGIAVIEVPVAYGHKFELSGGNLMVGGAIKYMTGITYVEELKIDNSDSDTDLKQDETSSSFGVDLGLAYEPSFVKDLTLALVAKNLNSPEFDFVTGSKATIDPMVRAGIAYDIFESLEVAADIDLTKNDTFVGDVKSQMLGGGLNYHPVSWFSVRAGLMRNIDSNDKADMIYTAGLGLGVKWFQLDLSGQMSQNTSTVDGEDYPQYAKVNLALISRW